MAAIASRKPRSMTWRCQAMAMYRQAPLSSRASVHHSVANRPRTPTACSDGTVSAASLISASLKMKTTTDADIAKMPRVLSITRCSSGAGHLHDQLPVRVAHRHHREPRLAHQLEVLERGVGLAGRERYRQIDRAHGLDVDRHRLARLVGGIWIGRLHHLGDADDLLALARVIEEAAVARLHRAQIGRGLRIAHAGPRGVLVLDELVPRIGRRLGLQQ